MVQNDLTPDPTTQLTDALRGEPLRGEPTRDARWRP